MKIPALLILPVIAFAFCTSADAQEQSYAKELDDKGWPATFETSDGFEVALHQPQVHDWPDYQNITLRAAVGVKPKEAAEDQVVYGALTIEATTTVLTTTREVYFGERRITELNFPSAPDEAIAERARLAVEAVMDPTRPLAVSLDRVLANAERYEQQTSPKGISVEAPPIFYSTEPAILVMFMGAARFEPVEGSSLLFAPNTNWDVLLDPSTTSYYLLYEKTWLTTKDVNQGPWAPTTELPEAIAKLPSGGDWAEVLAAVPPVERDGAPKVFVSDRPAELVMTDGPPSIQPITGTKILFLENSDSDIFLYENTYYFLTAGRWFKASSPEGPWETAMDSIPEDFAMIPEDHPKEHVLASIPGTPAAEEAVIMAQIPQMAEVNRSEATLEVKYEGDPQFIDIEETNVKYAMNTPNDVFFADGQYYCCEKGVWFVSISADGPWSVADEIPEEIYAIPASSPKHNVTYVHVYESDPETVTVGYTSGYEGAYVLGDLLVFGAGLWLTYEILDHWSDHWHCWHWHHHPCHWSYGGAVRYGWTHGGYYRVQARAYGPYGGAGYGAVYNPWTGGYARAGAVYGPRGGVGYARAGYNPWTNTYGARVGASTPYGSWGRSVAVRGDDWVRTGYRSDARGSVRAGETSAGGKGIKVDRRFGPDGGAIKTRNDDLYVGRDGNLYKRDESGDWSNLKPGGWDPVERPEPVDRGSLAREGAGERTRTALPPGYPSSGFGGNRPVSTQPVERPATPGANRPVTTQPVTRPERPVTTQPVQRPTAQPVQRPTVQPQPTYQRTQPSTSYQLQRDYQARQRGASRTQTYQRSYSRGGGGGFRRR